MNFVWELSETDNELQIGSLFSEIHVEKPLLRSSETWSFQVGGLSRQVNSTLDSNSKRKFLQWKTGLFRQGGLSRGGISRQV